MTDHRQPTQHSADDSGELEIIDLATSADKHSDTIDAGSTEALGLATKPLSPARLAWHRFRRHKLALVGVGILLIMGIMCVFANLFTKYSPLATHTMGPGKIFIGPTHGHWFGVDELGRDMWSRVLYGGRISLAVGVAVALISSAVGTTVGVIAAYYGRWLDNLLMRFTDLFLAVPLLVIAIIAGTLPSTQAWAATVIGPPHSVRAVVTILAAFFWMQIARVVRGLSLSLKEKEFVEAAHSNGASDFRIMARHIVPNCTGQIIISTTIAVAEAILVEATLSFLGYGIDPVQHATWGNLLTNSLNSMTFAPYLVWFPGIAIVLTVLAVNFLGDGLRDALDPKQMRV